MRLPDRNEEGDEIPGGSSISGEKEKQRGLLICEALQFLRGASQPGEIRFWLFAWKAHFDWETSLWVGGKRVYKTR